MPELMSDIISTPNVEAIEMRSSKIKDATAKAIHYDKHLPLISEAEHKKTGTVIEERKFAARNTADQSKRWRKVVNLVKATTRIKPEVRKPPEPAQSDSHDSLLRKFSILKAGSSKVLHPENADELAGKRRFTLSNGIPIKGSDDQNFSHTLQHRFVVNPEGNRLFAWLGLVTATWLYTVWSLIARQAFKELQEDNSTSWLVLDYLSDFLYAVDILVQLRTGFLENGMLVCQTMKLVKNYVFSKRFFLDILCLAPVDLAYLTTGKMLPVYRAPRFLKAYRAKQFYRKAESATSYPNALRVLVLSHTMMLLIHWFACFYYMISESEGFPIPEGSDRGWAYPLPRDNSSNLSEWWSLRRKYLHSLYWSCLTLTTIGEKNSPGTNLEYVCTLAAYFLGIFVFATVVGQVGNVIANKNANRLEYERMVDNAKTFMKTKNVSKDMQTRILRWYEYSWSLGTWSGSTDVNNLGMLPDSLKVELAIQVNFSTLKKVTIFKLVQPEFLYQLVLKMKSRIYTPSDLVCRQGEVATEMYIINHGILEVVSESGAIVARLKPGDFFGEIGILNIVKGANQRVANVRSAGYAEVFTLAGADVIQAMEYYPDAKQLLMMYGRRRLEESSSGPVLDVRDTVIEENERRAPETQHSENSFLMKRKRRTPWPAARPQRRNSVPTGGRWGAELLAASVASSVIDDVLGFSSTLASNQTSASTGASENPRTDDLASTSAKLKDEMSPHDVSQNNEWLESDIDDVSMSQLIAQLRACLKSLEARKYSNYAGCDGGPRPRDESEAWKLVRAHRKELAQEKAKVASLNADVQLLMEKLHGALNCGREEKQTKKDNPPCYNMVRTLNPDESKPSGPAVSKQVPPLNKHLSFDMSRNYSVCGTARAAASSRRTRMSRPALRKAHSRPDFLEGDEIAEGEEDSSSDSSSAMSEIAEDTGDKESRCLEDSKSAHGRRKRGDSRDDNDCSTSSQPWP